MSSINKQNKNLKFIDKKTESFSNVDRIHCVQCYSTKVKFKKDWEWIDKVKVLNLNSNVECMTCGYKFMDSEWDDKI